MFERPKQGRRAPRRQGMRARKRAGEVAAGRGCIKAAIHERARAARRVAHVRAVHEDWTAGLARSLMGVTNDENRRRAHPC